MTSDTAPRVRNRRGEGARLRADLVRAAGRLLAEGGAPEHVSLRQVAEAVGVTAPSIYRHFPNKEALLLAVVAEQFEGLQRVLAEALDRGGDDPFAAMREAGRAYVAMGRARPAHYEVLFGPIGGAILGLTGEEGMATGPGEFGPGDLGQGAFMMLVGLVERALAAGPGGARFDPFVVAVETWAFVHGLVDLVTAHAGFPWPSVDSVIDGWVDLLEQAVRGLPAAGPVDAAG
ncbi:MAG: TetR/AcrR family transcriptional regulator [Acidimicrobiales bacterium]